MKKQHTLSELRQRRDHYLSQVNHLKPQASEMVWEQINKLSRQIRKLEGHQ